MKRVQQVRFRASVVPKQRVLAARFALPRGHIIKADDLTMKPIDNENLPVIRFEEIIGTETTRAIGQNKSITKQDVKSVPLVRSNDIVTVTSRVGGISVRRQMKSRGNASRGETVTLISLDGRQSLQATVTAFHEAEIAGTSPKRAKYREASGSQILFQAPVASNNRDHVANYRSNITTEKNSDQDECIVRVLCKLHINNGQNQTLHQWQNISSHHAFNYHNSCQISTNDIHYQKKTAARTKVSHSGGDD